jgi:hypothetical protein
MMKQPMHLIVDTHLRPSISLFWQRHGLRIMEQLVPNEFSCTSRGNGLSSVFAKAIWGGHKKIVLIAPPEGIREAFNELMKAGPECRASLMVGFWPLTWLEVATWLMQFSRSLTPFLQVFRAGHAMPVDVVKVQYLTDELHTTYFWDEFLLSSTHPSAHSVCFVDDADYTHSGAARYRVLFHEQQLSSLSASPGEFSRNPMLRLFASAKDPRRLRLQSRPLPDQLVRTAQQLEIQGNWANLILHSLEVRDPVQSVHFEVVRRAFSLMVPMIPIRSPEPIRERLLPLPVRNVATARELPRNSMRSGKKNDLG